MCDVVVIVVVTTVVTVVVFVVVVVSEEIMAFALRAGLCVDLWFVEMFDFVSNTDFILYGFIVVPGGGSGALLQFLVVISTTGLFV